MIHAKPATEYNNETSHPALIESLLQDAHSALISSTEGHRSDPDKVSLLNTVKQYAEDILGIDEQNSDAHHMLALSHTLLGESSRAKRHIAKAIENTESNTTLLLEKAHIDMAAGHFNKAERGFLDVLQMEPTNADAFLGIAITRQKKKDWGSAFLHYNTLINKGLVNQTVLTGLSAVVPHIAAETWSEEYENTILTGLAHATDAKSYAHIANTLLIQKYALDHEDSKLDFVELVSDDLFYRVIDDRLICTPEVEQLAGLLRQTLFLEIAQSGNMPEEVQDWVLTIAEAASESGHCWPVSESEMQIVNDLGQAIKQACKGNFDTTDIVGAVMLYSMYEELYSAPFSFLLLGKDLPDWPQRLHSLLATSLYEPSQLHAVEVDLKQAIYVSQAPHIYQHSATSVYPKWSHVAKVEEQSAAELLIETFGEAVPFKAIRKRPLNVLVSACGTGQKALQQAAAYTDVNLVGADARIANLAFAEYQARNLNIDNVRWVQCTEDKLTCLNQQFDIVDWTSSLNESTNLDNTLDYIKRLMARNGVLKLPVEINCDRPEANTLKQLAIKNQLAPTIDTVRVVRKALMEDARAGDWNEILANPDFYHAGGCFDLFFGSNYVRRSAKELDEALAKAGLELFGIAQVASDKFSCLTSISTWESGQPLTIEDPKSLVLFCKKSVS